MAAQDWDDPVVGTLYTEVLSELKNRDENVAKMDYTSDTDVPNDFIRANTADSDKLERYNGATWDKLAFQTTIDNHIADTDIHAEIDSGSVMMTAAASTPTGWLFCRGQAVNRLTYAALYTSIGISYGSGDGVNTFNVPDFRRVFPLGKADSGDQSNLGDSGGTWDHTHSLPNHTHTLATHTHTMANHTHDVFAHTHNVTSAHTHGLPAHYHDTQAAGSTISISGGAHYHKLYTQSNSAGGSNRKTINQTLGADEGIQTQSEGASAGHSHPQSEFSGALGNVSFGVDGDAPMTSDAAGAFSTDLSTATASDTPSTNTTDAGGTTTTDSGGSGTSGVENPPYLVVNFIIKT